MIEELPDGQYWVDALGGARFRLGLAEGWLERLSADPVALEIAPAGTRVRQGETLGFLHEPGRVHDLRAPFALTVERPNEAAEGDARLVRLSPYARGWLLEGARAEAAPAPE